MSKRALWLAYGALSVGFVVVSCTGSDGSADFDATGGDGAAGDDASAAGKSGNGGTPNTGGGSAQAGADQGSDGGSSPTGGGRGPGQAGAPAGGSESSGGQPGAGGDSAAAGAAGAAAGDAGAGGSGPARVPCDSLTHCDNGQVCVKAGCDDQDEGVCADAPAVPVCGCDGVTYYNGMLAIKAAQDVRGNGVCKGETAVACDGECKEGLTCGMVELRDGDCEAKVGGVCWQLPAQCPAIDLTLYSLCGSEKCLSLCEAVAEGAHAVPAGVACPVIN